MTGRELIIYIMANHLEDELIFKDGRLVGFMTVEEAAVKFDVGTGTIRTWCKRGKLKSAKIFGEVFIPWDADAVVLYKERLKKIHQEALVAVSNDDSRKE